MAVTTFYNPDLVGQLAACGITARRAPNAPARGFVLEGRRNAPRTREAVTNVIAVQGHVRITGPRPQLAERPPQPLLTAGTATEPQTALELVEENARLRRDNQRLTSTIDRLREELARLTAGPNAPARQPPAQDLDDAATRFSLLELDL